MVPAVACPAAKLEVAAIAVRPLSAANQATTVRQRDLIARHRRPGDVAGKLVHIQRQPRRVQAAPDRAVSAPTAHKADRIALIIQGRHKALERAGGTSCNVSCGAGNRSDVTAADLGSVAARMKMMVPSVMVTMVLASLSGRQQTGNGNRRHNNTVNHVMLSVMDGLVLGIDFGGKVADIGLDLGA